MAGSLTDALAEYRDSLARPGPTASPRRLRFWLVVALALVVLVGGAWTALWGGPSDDRATSAAPEAATAGEETLRDPPAARGAEDSSAAPLAAADDPLTVAPPTTWRVWSSPVLSSWLPAADGVGPRDPGPGRLAGTARGVRCSRRRVCIRPSTTPAIALPGGRWLPSGCCGRRRPGSS